MGILSMVEINDKHYFVDRRLNQLRNVNNPHDYINFSN